MATKDFFTDDTPHGLVKRFMYKRYLQAYIPKTQKYYRTVILDGFAGAGKYSDDWPEDIEKYGSPIIAVRVAVEFCKRDILFSPKEGELEHFKKEIEKRETISVNLDGIKSRIILIFVESNKKRFNDLLTNVCKTFNFYGVKFDLRSAEDHIHITVNDPPEISIHCKLYCASFDQVNAPVNPSCEWETRYLTFIDPFGYSHTPMRHVRNFVDEHREVYINLMSSYVNRFLSQNPRAIAGLYDTDIPPEMTDENEVAEHVKALVRNGDGEDDLDNCVSNYVAALKERLPDSFVLKFEMRNKTNARIFHLVFVSNHIEGLKAMKESMVCGTQEQCCFRMSDYNVLMKGIKMCLKNEQDDSLMADEIYSRFENKSNVPVREVEDYIVTETPFVFRKKALKILEKERKVLTVSSCGNKKRRRGTYPENTDCLLSFLPATDHEV